MQKMYEDYKDIAEFRLVYVHEAHAADSSWPVEYAKTLGINKAQNYGDRCTTAEMMMRDENVTIPCIIDGMDNKVDTAYKAWPDRVFLVRKDGRLAVAAKRGPWGFKPGLDQTKEWLAAYRKTGEEPPLPQAETPATPQVLKKQFDKAAARALVGAWDMASMYNGQSIPAVMTLEFREGRFVGTWSSMDQKMEMHDLHVADGILSFSRTMGRGGMRLNFTGRIDGDSIEGSYKGDFGEIECSGTRQGEL